MASVVQARGALTSAQPQTSEPLPPFERWSMAAPRYIQFLVDLHHVHAALEATIAAAPKIAATKHYGAASIIDELGVYDEHLAVQGLIFDVCSGVQIHVLLVCRLTITA